MLSKSEGGDFVVFNDWIVVQNHNQPNYYDGSNQNQNLYAIVIDTSDFG